MVPTTRRSSHRGLSATALPIVLWGALVAVGAGNYLAKDASLNIYIANAATLAPALHGQVCLKEMSTKDGWAYVGQAGATRNGVLTPAGSCSGYRSREPIYVPPQEQEVTVQLDSHGRGIATFVDGTQIYAMVEKMPLRTGSNVVRLWVVNNTNAGIKQTPALDISVGLRQTRFTEPRAVDAFQSLTPVGAYRAEVTMGSDCAAVTAQIRRANKASDIHQVASFTLPTVVR